MRAIRSASIIPLLSLSMMLMAVNESGADSHTIGILATVTDDVKTHVAARRLDSSVTFSHRRFEFARHFSNGRPLGQHF